MRGLLWHHMQKGGGGGWTPTFRTCPPRPAHWRAVLLLKKYTLRVSGGCSSSQCRLMSTQWLPGEVHGCSQFWNRAGSEFPAFGVWPLSPQLADSGVWGHNKRILCGTQGTATNPARPMAPAVPRAP